jgi:hypothetical protein
MKPFDIRNRLQITATSNFDDALQIDNNDRRWAVCELQDPIKEQDAIELYAFLNSERAPGVLRHIFGAVDLVGFNPTARAPTTVAKVTMIRAGIGQWESTIIERMAMGLPPFHRDIFQVQNAFEELAGKNGPPSAHAMRAMLTKAPFNCQHLERQGRHRMYAWRNIKLWQKASEADRIRHLETGIRPPLVQGWSDEIPPGILNMSNDGPPDAPAPLSDLAL